MTGTHQLSKEALLSSRHTTAQNILKSSWCWQRRCSALARKSEMDIEKPSEGFGFQPNLRWQQQLIEK